MPSSQPGFLPAPPPAPPPEADRAPPTPTIEVHADLQNLFLFRNDADFDRTRPYYNENGQTVGAFATVFRPSFIFHITDNLRLFYQAEIGLNYWSKNNPDEQYALAADVFVMKHREIWAAGDTPDLRAGFKVGYGYFQDASALFIGHWLGMAQGWVRLAPRARLDLYVGQMPDGVYEGINVIDNNFKRDIFVFGGTAALALTDRLQLAVGVADLVDTHLVAEMRWIVAPNFQLQYWAPRTYVIFSGVVQAGQLQGTALGGGAQTQLAWAAQAHVWHNLRRRWELQGNVLLLSPDDAHAGNGRNYAFLYSGKSTSSTLMLTEDEIRDWYDNIDERMSAYDGSFFMNRAGLMVADVKLSYAATEHFRPGVVLGGSTVLKPANALDHLLVGIEADLVLEWRVWPNLFVHLVGGTLIPGGAGAALLNRIDRTRTDPMWMIESSLMLRY
jgi:hypothetical protein